MMKAMIRHLSLGCMLVLGAHQAVWGADPAHGKDLYNGLGGARMGSNSNSCMDCHNADPTRNTNSDLSMGSVTKSMIQTSINTNAGNMGEFVGVFSDSELDDIAAYLNAQPTPSAATMAFGAMLGSSQTRTITLTNTGGLYMKVNQISRSGPQAGEFTVVGGSSCLSPVMGGSQTKVLATSSCTIQVTFTPVPGATHQASLDITASQVNVSGAAPPSSSLGPVTLSVPLTGTLSSLTLSPNQLTLALASDGQSWLPAASQVTNAGSTAITITGVTAVSPKLVLASGPGYCSNGQVLAAGGQCQVGVSVTGAVSDAVTIATSDGSQSLPVVAALPPVASATTASADSSSNPTNQGGGGCTIAGPNAEFDPIWLSMLLAGGALRAWRTRRQESVDEQV
jgi:cytochrome c553